METKIDKIYRYNSIPSYEGLYGKLPIIAHDTFVGVEIELEECLYSFYPESICTRKEDGSLKLDGSEFVTIPLRFKYLEVELIRIFKSISSCRVSSRCSVHVHVNVRDLTIKDLYMFMLLYLIFERSLYRYSGDRWDSIFCVPLSFNKNLAKDFFRGLKRGFIPERWYKYLGFNISPIFGGESTKLGTIEFRHLQGTTNVPHIINWINLILSLKEAAKRIEIDDFLASLHDMNTTSHYNILVNDIFKDFSHLLTEQPTFKKDVEEGVLAAKEVSLPTTRCIYEITSKGIVCVE